MDKYLKIIHDFDIPATYSKKYYSNLWSLENVVTPETYYSLWDDVGRFWKENFAETVEYVKRLDGLKQYYVDSTIPYVIAQREPYEPFPTFLKKSSLYSDLIILYDPLCAIISACKYGYQDLSYWKSKGFQNDSKGDEDLLFFNAQVIPDLRSFTGMLVRYARMLETFQDWIRKGILVLLPGIEFPKVSSIGKLGLTSSAVDEYLRNCSGLDAIASTEDEYAWHFIMKRVKKDSLNKDLVSLAALTELDLEFFNNVTPDFALKIREEGVLSELRDFFRQRFGAISKTPDEKEFRELTNNLRIEMTDAIKKSKKEWDYIRRSAHERIGVKSSLVLASGFVAAAISYGLTIPSWIGLLGASVFSGYTAKDIVNEVLDFREKKRKLHRNASYWLYKLKET